MSKLYNELTGLVTDYDLEANVDEWIVCSAPTPGHPMVGRSCHNDIRLAKIAQINLFLEEDIDAWIEYIPAFDGPNIETQLTAERRMS